MTTDIILQKINSARDLLAESNSLGKINEVIAIADALIIFGARLKASQEAMNNAGELRLRAERRLGEILKSMPKNKGGQPMQSTGSKKVPVGLPPMQSTGSKKVPVGLPPTLADSGIDKKVSARAQELASVPESEFQAKIDDAKDGELVPTKFYAQIHREQSTGSKKVPVEKPPSPFPDSSLIDDAISALAKLKGILVEIVGNEDASKTGDPCGFHMKNQRQEWLKGLDGIRWHLRKERPYAVCPYCEGKCNKCSGCKNVGWVGKDTYDRAPKDYQAKVKGTIHE